MGAPVSASGANATESKTVPTACPTTATATVRTWPARRSYSASTPPRQIGIVAAMNRSRVRTSDVARVHQRPARNAGQPVDHRAPSEAGISWRYAFVATAVTTTDAASSTATHGNRATGPRTIDTRSGRRTISNVATSPAMPFTPPSHPAADEPTMRTAPDGPRDEDALPVSAR